MKTRTKRRHPGSSVGWCKKGTDGQLVIAFSLAASFGCRSSGERARAEMQPVYRSAKLMMERLKAGADFKEFGRLRGDLTTELSIVRDRMNANTSAGEPLRKYYAAYQGVLGLYSFAARVWEDEISLDQCMGPAVGGNWYEDFKAGDHEKAMSELRALNAWEKRFEACFAGHHEVYDEIYRQAASPELNCVECEAPPDHGPMSQCVFKKAEARLLSAEALLLKH